MSEQSQGTWLTQEAYDRLAAELEHRKTTERKEIAQRVEAARHAVEPVALSTSLSQPLRRRRSCGPARIRPPRRPAAAPEYSSTFRQSHSIPSGCGVDSRFKPGRPREEPPGVVVAR